MISTHPLPHFTPQEYFEWESHQQFSRYPCLIIEVLSPNTEAYDRGGKFTLYRRLERLQEYVLVGTEAQQVDVFRRKQSGAWMFMPYGKGEEIELTSIGLTVPMAIIYEDVVLVQSPATQRYYQSPIED